MHRLPSCVWKKKEKIKENRPNTIHPRKKKDSDLEEVRNGLVSKKNDPRRMI